jgi:hypothetical protein
MFVIDAAIGNGHIVPGKFSHFSTQGNVLLRERRVLHTVCVVFVRPQK